MRNRMLFAFSLLAFVSGGVRAASEDLKARAFAGNDLHLGGREALSHQLSSGGHILVFPGGFDMSAGGAQLASGRGVVWLLGGEAGTGEAAGLNYQAIAYLEGGVSVKGGGAGRVAGLREVWIEKGRAMAVSFGVSGEVFVTADTRQTAEVRGLEIYARAFGAVSGAGFGTLSPEAEPREVKSATAASEQGETPAAPPAGETKKPEFQYPINLAGAGEVEPTYRSSEGADGNDVTTVIGRFYLWQKQDEEGGLLELQADNAVIFHSGKKGKGETGQVEAADVLAKAAPKGIYLSGDVLMAEGSRTIRADEVYYDFKSNKAIIKNAVMKSFDTTEGIPIYIRAEEFRQLAMNKFAADNITVTSSEFYVPQISASASNVTLTDTTSADERKDKASKSSYDVEMHDVRFKWYDKTIFYWPEVRGNTERPDLPLKSGHVGHDNTWGSMVETRWYLARLLGLQEPEGTESTFGLDYYSKRGVGTGVEVDYVRENYFGKMVGYIIDDHGEDRLGRASSRRNLEPPRELRGRFGWLHRQFLPYNWQLTTEVSYISDRHFLESFYRSEFNLGKEQETLVHLKRIEENWGLSLLGKGRINNFSDTLEELPSGAFHWTGQSFFDDKLTLYSDTEVSRLRQRYDSSRKPRGSEQFYSYAMTRNEVDLPLRAGGVKVVPFVAGTVAYEDGLGFRRELDGGEGAMEDAVVFGETGVRASTLPYWRVFPEVKSRLWDLNQLRHVIQPHLTAVGYAQSESVIEQRDTVNVGISQRLQTKRGSGDRERTVDWMRLDMDVTWVNDSGDSSSGPDRFLWNKPFIPTLNTFGGVMGQGNVIFQRDRRGSTIFGPRRNSITADYIWRLSDTAAILSDMNFDMQSGVVQQFDIGFSRLCWPNLSYYLGSRYLRRVEVVDEKGSNALTFAITYVLDPRYTVVFSQQVDFDYGSTIRSDITLIRRYHRVFWGLTFSADESLDEQSIVFSVWPQGVPELAIGPQRYMGLGGAASY